MPEFLLAMQSAGSSDFAGIKGALKETDAALSFDVLQGLILFTVMFPAAAESDFRQRFIEQIGPAAPLQHSWLLLQ